MLKVIENEKNLSVERRCVSGTRGDYYLSVLFVLICFAIIAIFANKFRDGVWSTLDWFFVSLIPIPFLILVVFWNYVRQMELNERGYFEEARLGVWVLWSESYSHVELRPFTVEVLYYDGDQDFIVCLHELDGEVRRGISFCKEKDAEELCERLNRLLTHYQQDKSVRSAAGSSRSGESHLKTR